MNNKWRYLIVMVLGVAMNQGLSFLAEDYPVWLDVSGTAMAALVLEPAAGLVVGLVDNFCIALFKYNQSSLIYYCVSAAVAVIVGVLMRDGEGKIKWQRVFVVIPLVIVASTFLSSILTLWRSGGISNAPFEAEKYQALINMGINRYAACFISVGIVKIYDTIITAAIVALVYFMLPKKLKETSSN